MRISQDVLGATVDRSTEEFLMFHQKDDGVLDAQIVFRLIRQAGPSLHPVPVPPCVHGRLPFLSNSCFNNDPADADGALPPERWFPSPRDYAPLPPPGRYRLDAIGRNHFLVRSLNGTRAVDLDAYAGHGACTCPHFLSRLAPDLDKNKAGPEHRWDSDCSPLGGVKGLVGKPLSPFPTRILLADETTQTPTDSYEIHE